MYNVYCIVQCTVHEYVGTCSIDHVYMKNTNIVKVHENIHDLHANERVLYIVQYTRSCQRTNGQDKIMLCWYFSLIILLIFIGNSRNIFTALSATE